MERKINKKFYFVLFLVLSASAFLLGLSYSKESSKSEEVDLNESFNNNLRVVMSDSFTNIVFTDSVYRDISIINRGNSNVKYAIKIDTNNLEGLSYSLDSEEVTDITDSIIYIGDLSKLGTDNDRVAHKLTIYNNSGNEIKVSINAVEYNELLKDKITSDNNVYVDSLENYRYYGNQVNNYIKYDNQLYRIVGIINNSIMLIDVKAVGGTFDSNKTYLTVYDYLQSFNNDKVTMENTSKYDSWLNDMDNYWLADTYGDYDAFYVSNRAISSSSQTEVRKLRSITKLNIDCKVVLGDGSENNPYEVIYES